MNGQAATNPRPLTLRDMAQKSYHDISLQQATQLALVNSKILVDLGGQVVRSPDSLPTAYDVASRRPTRSSVRSGPQRV